MNSEHCEFVINWEIGCVDVEITFPVLTVNENELGVVGTDI